MTMEGIKRLQDSLYRKIEDELKKRDDTIEELRKQLGDTEKTNDRAGGNDTEKLKRLIREKDKEIETLKAKSLSYMKVLEETSERTLTDATKKATKKNAVSAEPITLRHSQIINFSLNKVPKNLSSSKIIKSAFTDNDFMRHLDSTQINEIVDCMTEMKCDKDELIIREGEVGFKVYVLEEGTVEVTKDKKVLSTLGSGKIFGELAILFNCTRTTSVKALAKCRLWAIDRQSFQQIMMKTTLKKHAEHVDFLKTVPKLRDLPEEAMNEVADALEEIHYEKGTYIVRQNNHGDTFFILSKGMVKVTETKGDSDQEVELRTLSRGDYFGERALEKAYVRTANVIVTDPDGADCLCIDLETYMLLRKVIVSSEDAKPPVKKPAPTPPPRKNEFASLFLSDLSIITTLGVGGFGRVELVFIKKSISKKTYALKLLKKHFIKQTRQIEHVKNEKSILLDCNNDFIVKLHRTFRDRKYLYMLMDACLGGELWTVLRDRQFFDDNTARFYTGCVIEAFDYLHEKGIVYRDLKPENLLIEGLGPRKGYVKLVDFGFAKKVGHSKTWTFCGTPEYVAPEIILNKGHDVAADLWSLGILIYELLNGTPPFSNTDSMKTYNMILKGVDSVSFPKRIGKNAIVIIKKFCRDVPTDRLGYGKNGYKDIQKQRWYSGFNWDGLKRGTLRPPIVPIVKDERDTSRFDTYDSDSDEDNIPEDLTGWDREF